MPSHHDAGALWLISAIAALALAAGVISGRLPRRSGWIRRSETPGVFWFGIGIYGAFLFVMLFLATFASVSLPNEAGTGMR